MRILPNALQHLVGELTKLPGVGEKTALRYAVGLLKGGQKRLADLEKTLSLVRVELGACPRCFFWTENAVCSVCEDPARTHSQRICVVRDAPDVIALERFRAHPWRYHVLQGLLSPLGGVGPSQLRINELVERVVSETVVEVIFALDATVEGDATALYIREQIRARSPQAVVTRTALGLPAGASVEYLDPSTLESALLHRTQLGEDR